MSSGRSASSKRAWRTTAAAVCAGAVAVAPGAALPQTAEAPLRASAAAEVRVAQGADVSRLEVIGPAAGAVRFAVSGRTVTADLPAASRESLARLRVDPPPGVAAAEVRPQGAGLRLILTLAEGWEARSGRADGASYLQLLRGSATAGAAAEAPAARRADPVPASGVVPVSAKVENGRLTLGFPWAAPAPAAVFRRGEAVWIVFDAAARLDLSETPKSLGPVERIGWTSASGATLVRVEAPADVNVRAEATGATWTVVFGEPTRVKASAVAVGRDDQTGPAALTATLAGATRAVWIKDPAVGDRFAAVTALGPAKPNGRGRAFVEAALPPTAHGLLVETAASDLAVEASGDLVRLSRPRGLTLSPPSAGMRAAAAPGLPAPAKLPAAVDAAGWTAGAEGFAARYRLLQTLAAEEAGAGADAPVAARMALARFLVGSELSFEAIGVLDLLARQKPAMLGDPEFRGLRGAARVMARRYKEAQTDFAAPALAADPSAALWRGYVEAGQGGWIEARKAFQQGARAADLFPPAWRARFATAHAQAALETGDPAAARALIAYALSQEIGPIDQLRARLVQARLFEIDGDTDRAVRVYEAIATAAFQGVAAPAKLHATRLKLQTGRIQPVEAVRLLDGLKFRWRGDATELEIVRTVGEIYLSQGRYREALEALRGAGRRLPDLPAALKLQQDLSAAFRRLFLEGQADGLEPIQALALFYDFRELTPVGAEGDEMVRRLSRRLVDVDLLDPASELLAYQVDNRLDGVAKAQVAADLATVRLMDRDPEGALRALWGSRTSLVPPALATERRLLEARALTELGRFDHALEILGRDASPEAQDVRAEVHWRRKDWPQAGAALERRLGERFRTAGPLNGEEETRLIRAGVAFSMAGDAKALQRLAERFGGFVDQARNPEALRVALSGMEAEGVRPADFAKAAAQADAFAGWVAAAKQRFRERG